MVETVSAIPGEAAQSAPSTSSSPRTPVLYLNHSAQISGAENSLRSLLWGLRRADSPYEPIVALPDGGPLAEMLRDEGWNVTLAPLRRIHRPRGIIDGMSSLLHVLQTAPLICRLVESSGAKIIHSNSTTAHLVGGVAGERTHRPALWHCRDLVPLGRLAPQLAAKATHVIAISRCVVEQLEREGVPRDKISLVFNGIETDRWRPKGHSALRESLAWPETAFVFGMMGQLLPWKNHQEFIEAAAQLIQDENCSHARFAIIGGDLWGEQAAYVQELRALVKKHGLIDRFNFIPHQTNAIDAHSALDCLVHPAKDEPFGRVILEAMALSKPVIAKNQHGPSEIITHEFDGLLTEPEAEDGLSRAMKRVMLDAELRALLGTHARQSVEDKFHSSDHAAKIATIYHDLES